MYHTCIHSTCTHAHVPHMHPLLAHAWTYEGLNENGPVSSYVDYLVPSWLNCLGKVRKYGLVGGDVSPGAGAEVPEPCAFSASYFAIEMWILSCCSPSCLLPAAVSPAIMVMDSYAPGTESQIYPPLSVAFIVVYQIIIEKYLVQTLLGMKTALPPPPPHNVGLKVLHSN